MLQFLQLVHIQGSRPQEMIECQLSLMSVWLRARAFNDGGNDEDLGVTRGRKFNSHITGRWSVKMAMYDGTKQRAKKRICADGTKT